MSLHSRKRRQQTCSRLRRWMARMPRLPTSAERKRSTPPYAQRPHATAVQLDGAHRSLDRRSLRRGSSNGATHVTSLYGVAQTSALRRVVRMRATRRRLRGWSQRRTELHHSCRVGRHDLLSGIRAAVQEDSLSTSRCRLPVSSARHARRTSPERRVAPCGRSAPWLVRRRGGCKATAEREAHAAPATSQAALPMSLDGARDRRCYRVTTSRE